MTWGKYSGKAKQYKVILRSKKLKEKGNTIAWTNDQYNPCTKKLQSMMQMCSKPKTHKQEDAWKRKPQKAAWEKCTPQTKGTIPKILTDDECWKRNKRHLWFGKIRKGIFVILIILLPWGKNGEADFYKSCWMNVKVGEFEQEDFLIWII